jgi:acid phosphatase (class A)
MSFPSWSAIPSRRHPQIKKRKSPAGKIAPFLIAASYSISTPEHLPAQTTAAPTPPAPLHQAFPLSWINQAGIDYVLNAVPPPPVAGSDEDKADLQAVLKAQADRTPIDIEEARADRKFRIELLTRSLSPDFTARNYPVTFALLGRVLQDESFLTSNLKARYKRNRPYQDHPEVKNLFVIEHDGFSGEIASASRILVLVLAELLKDHIDDLLKRDEVLAQSGVKAGVIYPSDLIAGRAVAQALIFVLQGQPGFEAEMNRARVEINSKASTK